MIPLTHGISACVSVSLSLCPSLSLSFHPFKNTYIFVCSNSVLNYVLNYDLN